MSWRSAQLGQLRSRSKGKGHTVVPTVTEDGRTPPRSLQPDLDLFSSSFIITSEMNINPTRETNPTTLEYPHLSKKQTKHQIRVFATSLCHVVHTYYVEGISVADGSNGNLHLRVRTFSIHPRSGFSGRGWKGAKADVVNTIPGMELCWPSLSWEPRGPHCMCVIYSPTVHS